MAQNETERVFDELLVTLVQSGDRRAGERLAARWQPRLIRTARRLLRDDEAARDAVQEAWIGIFRGAAALADPARFPAWAFGILQVLMLAWALLETVGWQPLPMWVIFAVSQAVWVACIWTQLLRYR